MDNVEKRYELQQKLEKLIKEKSRVEDDIFRQEEKFDIRELKETDVRYKNMVWLRERYSTLDLEIYEIRKELEKLQENSSSQQRKVTVSEIKEVAEGQRIENKNGAINAVTSQEEEKTQEGQSHDDE